MGWLNDIFSKNNKTYTGNVYVQNPHKPGTPPSKIQKSITVPNRNIYVPNPHNPQLSSEVIISKPVTNTIDYETKTTKFRVAGLYYHLDNLIDAAAENDLYTWNNEELLESGEIIVYEYEFFGTIKLEEEPTNPYDSNAIRVLYDDNLIGYVPAKRCKSIKKLISSNSIVSISHNIRGGKYKVVYEADDYVDKREKSYIATIIITYKLLNEDNV